MAHTLTDGYESGVSSDRELDAKVSILIYLYKAKWQRSIPKNENVGTKRINFGFFIQEAYSHIKKCCATVRPNRGFIEQLSHWEEDVLGEKITDISDPNF